MPRREKRSRIKFLPPKIQLIERDGMFLSLPARQRISSDGRNPSVFSTAFDESIQLDFNQNVSMWRLWNGTTGLVAAYRFNKNTETEAGYILPINSGSAHRKITFTGVNAHPGRETPFPFEQNGYSLFLSSSTYGIINDPTNAFSFGDGGGSDVAFSVSMWFRPELNMHSSTSTTLLGKFNDAATNIEWYIYRTANQIYVYLYSSAGNYIAAYSTNGIFVEGVWHHLVVTYNGTSVASGIKIYRNGEAVATSTTSGGSYSFMTPTAANTVKICEMNGSERFHGHIDHLIVWRNVELSAADAKYLFTHFASEGGVQAVTKIPDDSLYNQYELRTDLIYANDSPIKGFSDKFITNNLKTKNPDLLKVPAFRETNRPQIDGMMHVSGSSLERKSFYATGSDVQTAGIGFSSPLWSKSIVEIDISTPTPVQFGVARVTGNDYPMAYYDFNLKTYVGVGSNKRVAQYGSDYIENYAREKAVGFFGSYLDDGVIDKYPENAGKKGDSFGFPYSQQYYVPGTSSVLYPLKNIINEPFLLEKVVLQFSGSFRNNGYSFPQTSTSPLNTTAIRCWNAVTTFFILNQHNSAFVSDSVGVIRASTGEVFSSPTIHRSGSMDLITYMQILCVSASTTEQQRPYFSKMIDGFENVVYFGGTSFTSSAFGYDGQFTLSSSVKIPTPTENICEYSFIDSPTVAFYYVIKANKGNRNGRGKICGRNWKNNFLGVNPVSSSYLNSNVSFTIPNVKSFNNPYILLPTDNLIFGWQVPESIMHKMSDTNLQLWSPGENTGPTLYFSGSAKVLLFGSNIRIGADGEYVESHDTLNQMLSSVTINEVIG